MTSLASASVSVTCLFIGLLLLAGQVGLGCGNGGQHGLEGGGQLGDGGQDLGGERRGHALDEAAVGQFAVCGGGQEFDRDAAGISGRLDGGQTVNVEAVVDLGGYGGRFDGIRVG